MIGVIHLLLMTLLVAAAVVFGFTPVHSAGEAVSVDPGEPWGTTIWDVLRMVIFVAAASVLSGRARTVRAEAVVWGWFARAIWTLAFAAAVTLALDVLANGGVLHVRSIGNLATALGVVCATPLLYQGLVRWNLHGTLGGVPGDWLNGLGAVVALTAAGNLVLPFLDSPLAGWHWWQRELWLLQVATEVILLLSAITIAKLAGLSRDIRAWALILSLVVVVTLSLVDLCDPLAGVGQGLVEQMRWTLPAVVLAVVAVARITRPLPRPLTAFAHSTGGFAVLFFCLVVLCAAGVSAGHLPDQTVRAATMCAVLGAVCVAVRGVRMTRLLADFVVHRREALTDDLTGLANRRAFHQHLHHAQAADRDITLIVIDLDRFKAVNDRLGHAAGDELLRRTATVLSAEAGAGTFVARLGGDEFAVVLPTSRSTDAQDLVNTLMAISARPVLIEGRRLVVTGSAGISSSRDAATVEQLLIHADAALYRAKAAGGAGAAIHDQAATDTAAENTRLVEELKVLLLHPEADTDVEGGQLELQYQPQLDRSGRLVGAEALVRWRHPRHGLLGPAAFLTQVEDYGLMPALTTEVLWQAARQGAAWNSKSHRLDMRISVNLSAACLTAPELPALVAEVLTGTGLAAQALVLEITETSLMADADASVARLMELSELGVGISIDDYGTGYSSLAYLRDLPAAELKLDRSLVTDVGVHERASDIVAGTIALAHRLGLRVVAEGVESAATLQVLHQMGCDETQGYLHSRPLSPPDLQRWADEHTTRPQQSSTAHQSGKRPELEPRDPQSVAV